MEGKQKAFSARRTCNAPGGVALLDVWEFDTRYRFFGITRRKHATGSFRVGGLGKFVTVMIG
jgi:hypothetical protein